MSPAKSNIVKIVSGLLHKYYDHLEQRLGKASRIGGAGWGWQQGRWTGVSGLGAAAGGQGFLGWGRWRQENRGQAWTAGAG